MASIIANISLPLVINGAKPSLIPTSNFPVCVFPVSERRGRLAVVVRATGDSSDSSGSLSVVESVQNLWDNGEDRIAVIGLGLTAVIAFWASLNLVAAIDKLPVIPGFLEFVGILFSSWFVYRYLLFKPDRQELFRNMNKSISNILGQ
ncbi:protein CURVATURE THYLAKOID 1C, chloroplastic [Beta vulgaris subsp. vulgaris]|uniref:protein CURVATURE THYLAKOID 1C, chloroplastic n=1 Tax=Beta vulgaris subsp. vulgaris TaxID=3555 RepID=UPI00203674B4|nr:protein CURVATURE THYLAKOID 1C, chloroplastic [Beta vulgaris subsp. vulgaris]XP_057247664.1 protein CURVATURE THYLAKOID 1C, chloroplastic [Beta vulgaris subsp. vulgaris]